jgi:hypothetical protein
MNRRTLLLLRVKAYLRHTRSEETVIVISGNGCPICDNPRASIKSMDPLDMNYSIQCDFCGTIYLQQGGLEVEKDVLRSYLFYYWIEHPSEERIFSFTPLTKNWPNQDKIQKPSVDDILNWYPKRFSDKIDLITNPI